MNQSSTASTGLQQLASKVKVAMSSSSELNYSFSESESESESEFEDMEDQLQGAGNDLASSIKICSTRTLAPSPPVIAGTTGSSRNGEESQKSSQQSTTDPVASSSSKDPGGSFQTLLNSKNLTIRDQEFEIDALHEENLILQKELREMRSCMDEKKLENAKLKDELGASQKKEIMWKNKLLKTKADLQKFKDTINLSVDAIIDNEVKDEDMKKEELNLMEDKDIQNDKLAIDDKRGPSPEINYSQQASPSLPEEQKATISNETLMIEKKPKKKVSFNLNEVPPTNRRSERISITSILSTSKISTVLESNITDESLNKVQENKTMEAMELPPRLETIVPPPSVATSLAENEENAQSLHGIDTNKRGFVCICGRQYQSKSKLMDHIRQFWIGKKYNCTSCSKKFHHAYLYRNHMKRTHEIKNINTRTKCGVVQKNSKLLRKHQIAKHGLTGLKRISVVDIVKKILKTPEKGQKANTDYECSTDAKRHRVDVTKDNGFFCICGVQCTTKIGLSMHVRYFSLKRNFKCTCCEKRFFATGDLRKHMKKTHQVNYDKTNGCRECGDTYATRKELLHHMMNLHNKGPIAVKRKFQKIAKNDLSSVLVESPTVPKTDGVVTITKEDTLISDQIAAAALLSLKCGEKIVKKTETKAGSATKNNEGTSPDVIGGGYIWCDSEELEEDGIRIMEVKSANESFDLEHGRDGGTLKCICGTPFCSLSSLTAHIRYRSGRKPFKCEECSEAFPRADYLKLHLTSSHKMVVPENTTWCTECGEKFDSRSELIDHHLIIHKNGPKARGRNSTQFGAKRKRVQ